MHSKLADKLLDLLQGHPDVPSFSASHLVDKLQAPPEEILAAAEELQDETKWSDDILVSVTYEKNSADQTVDYEVVLIWRSVSNAVV